MYHPDEGAGEEFIEIMNISKSITLNLGGISFTDGINYTIPAGTLLAAGNRMVIYASDFKNGTALSNGGELLKLEDASRSTILEFRYDDQAPWPISPDGGGTSLILKNPTLKPDPSLASNWRPSLTIGGNPGTTDAISFRGQANGDLNGNGIPDLIDYALGNGGMTQMNGDTFTYLRRLGADDATSQIEASTNLINWTDASALLIEQSRTDQGDGTALIKLKLSPAVLGSRWFFRIRVTLSLLQN
jgi:hypothetical protein